MIVDSSALVGILLREPDYFDLTRRLYHAEHCAMTAATYVEAAMVILSRQGGAGEQHLLELLDDVDMEIVPVDRALADLARAAFRRFGKGRHRAGLNFGDCFAYALARQRGEPLLYKGTDFGATDIESATSP